jgi:hypothetical protein
VSLRREPEPLAPLLTPRTLRELAWTENRLHEECGVHVIFRQTRCREYKEQQRIGSDAKAPASDCKKMGPVRFMPHVSRCRLMQAQISSREARAS